MSKELFMAAHEELTEELMEEKGMTWSEAYDAASDLAYARMYENMADYGDYLKKRAREEQ